MAEESGKRISVLGDAVKIRYVQHPGSTDPPASWPNRGTLRFALGAQDIIPGLSEEVVGMSPGETRRIKLTPPRAFGENTGAIVHRLSSEKVPPDAKIGDGLMCTVADLEVNLWIVGKDESDWLVCADHPWAGKVIDLEITLSEIEE